MCVCEQQSGMLLTAFSVPNPASQGYHRVGKEHLGLAGSNLLSYVIIRKTNILKMHSFPPCVPSQRKNNFKGFHEQISYPTNPPWSSLPLQDLPWGFLVQPGRTRRTRISVIQYWYICMWFKYKLGVEQCTIINNTQINQKWDINNNNRETTTPTKTRHRNCRLKHTTRNQKFEFTSTA